MSEIADEMQDTSQLWADESVLCEKGHRYLPSEFGCPVCEMENEDIDAFWDSQEAPDDE